MPTYTVSLRLVADDSDALLARIEDWATGDEEGVLTISHQPDIVQIPSDLAPPATPPILPAAGRRLDSVDPAEGPAAGGTAVTLHGAGFTNIGGVRFEGGGMTGWADAFTVVDDTTITCTTPSLRRGPATVIAFRRRPRRRDPPRRIHLHMSYPDRPHFRYPFRRGNVVEQDTVEHVMSCELVIVSYPDRASARPPRIRLAMARARNRAARPRPADASATTVRAARHRDRHPVRRR